MKIVSALVCLLRYETKSLTDIHQLKKQPLAPATKHLQTPKNTPLPSKKYRLIIHTGQPSLRTQTQPISNHALYNMR